MNCCQNYSSCKCMNQIQYNQKFEETLNEYKNKSLYRNFNYIKKSGHPLNVQIKKDKGFKDCLVFCGNDYLGLSFNKLGMQEQINVINKTGIGSGGTRNISGSSVYHQQLEQVISNWYQKESSLIFTSCYTANQGVMNSLQKVFKDIIYLSDSDNHSSQIEGIKNSRAEKVIYKNNDMVDLESKIVEIRKNQPQRPICIVFESLYSMSGVITDIKKTVEIAKKYNCLTFCDEVHSLGMYGERGSGISELQQTLDQVDIISGTLSKSIGCFGGFITGNALIIDSIRTLAQNFIFTSSIPPSLARAATVNILLIQSEEGQKLRDQIHNNANYIRQQLDKYKIQYINSKSQIICIKIYNAQKAKLISEQLINDYNIYVQNIQYPTVQKGKEILRISSNSKYTKEQMDYLVASIDKLIDEYQIERQL